MNRTAASPVEFIQLADDDIKSITGGLKAQWMDDDGGDGGGDGGGTGDGTGGGG